MQNFLVIIGVGLLTILFFNIFKLIYLFINKRVKIKNDDIIIFISLMLSSFIFLSGLFLSIFIAGLI